MFSGLIVTTMGDRGPYPVLNLSSLPEDTAENLSVVGMTILFMGAGTVTERQHYRLHGSLPIPNSPDLEALAMSFAVSPTETTDVRIDQHGRESTIWLLFNSTNRATILQMHQVIEKTLQEETKNLITEEDISNAEKMEEILTRLTTLCETADAAVIERVEPKYIVERGGLEFFTIVNEGEMKEIDSQTDLTALPVLILVNTLLQRILIIKLKESTPQRIMFHAGTSASNINTNRFKNRFTIRAVSDPMEIEMILEKVGIIQEMSSN